VLLCRTYPAGPLDVTLAYPRSRIIDGGVGRREGAVVGVTPVAHDTLWVRVQLDPDGATGTGVEFEPGQFVELQVPGDDRRRAYSLANTANWDGELEFLIRLHEGGYFSKFLLGLGTDPAPVIVHGPLGAFGLRESGLRPRWFVAGGTGLAPMLSMLRQMAEWAQPHPARLFLGVNQGIDVPDLEVLRALERDLPGFGTEICVWSPDADWAGSVGTPSDALARALARGGQTPDVYVCGPPQMVDAVQRTAREAGLSDQQVICERLLPT
jgi:NAD(P)H-flavin reductase